MRDDEVTGDADVGAVRLLREFVNTAEPQVGGERLTGPDALTAWCREHGLLEPADPGAGATPTLTADDVVTAVDLREGLRAVLRSHAGHAAPGASLSTLERVLSGVPLRARLDAAGDLRLRAAADRPIDRVVAGVLDAVRQATADGTWGRLKVCARDSCRWAFYDASRNRSGRWCSMAGCGNVVKMQRAHARRREPAGPASARPALPPGRRPPDPQSGPGRAAPGNAARPAPETGTGRA
jgi:predicted RNA-binding Zn ribbon-like protein